MTSEHTRQKALLEELLALTPEAQQLRLNQADVSDESRAELRALLLHQNVTQAGFQQAVSAAAADWSQAQAFEHMQLGAWRLVELLGKGGMGEVYLAERSDGAFSAQAAVKMLSLHGASAQALQRFKAEQQSLAKLDHPNIARLLDAGISPQSVPYFVMEYVQGKTLDLAAEGLDLRARAQLFLQLTDAVAFAHRHLIVHRDLKPSNVLVRADGVLKLLDFGIAKVLNDTALPSTETQPGHRFFTPRYATPEQVEGRPVTTATDVYALGLILYELLTGLMPYGDETNDSAASAIAAVTSPVRAPSKWTATPLGARWPKFRRQIQGDLEAIILTALQKAPEARYASVDAFAADLRDYLLNRPIRARVPSWPTRAWKFVQRNRLLATALVASVCSIAIGSSWALIAAKREAAQRVLADQRAAEAEAVLGIINRLFESIDPAQAQGKTPTVLEVIEPVLKDNYEAPKDAAVAAKVDLVLSGVLERIGRARNAYDLAMRASKRIERASGIDPALRASVALRAHQALWTAITEMPEADRPTDFPKTVDDAAYYAYFQGAALLDDPHLSRSEWVEAQLFRAHIMQMARNMDASQKHFEWLITQLQAPVDQALLVTVQADYLTVLAKWRRFTPEHFPLAQAAIDAVKAKHGELHPDMVSAKERLAMFNGAYHRYAEAIALQRDVLRIATTIYGEDFPDLTYQRLHLASLLIKNGEAKEALGLTQKVVDTEHRAGYDTYGLSWHAMALFKSGQIDAAEKAFVRLIDTLKGNDPWTDIPAKHRYAMLLIGKGKLAQAEAYLTEAAMRAPVAFGADNPIVTEMAAECAELWLAQKNYARVLKDLPPLMEKMQAKYGDQAKPVVEAKRRLALANQ
jgi:serine/threonine protein kinase/tetratricopeptide (TPR) repeat protein